MPKIYFKPNSSVEGIAKEVSGSDASLRELVGGEPLQWGLGWKAQTGGLAMQTYENANLLMYAVNCKLLLPPVRIPTGLYRAPVTIRGPLVVLRYDARGRVIDLTPHDLRYIRTELMIANPESLQLS